MHLSRLAFAILLFDAMAVQAHLAISPPQIIRSSSGIALTEVRSTAEVTSYWQVRVVKWSQQDEKSVLDAANDIPISPRFFHLKPGESQVIRALFPKTNQHYYRILIEQIPPDSETQGVTLNFRFSLPVYLFSNEPVARKVDFPVEKKCVSISNPTDRVQQLILGFQPQNIPVILPQSTMPICKKESEKL